MTWEIALLLWYVALIAVFWQVNRHKVAVAGLILCYWINLASHHVVTETLCILYENKSEYRSAATLGFVVSGYAMLGLLGGLVGAAVLVPARSGRSQQAGPGGGAGQHAAVDIWFGPSQLAVVVGMLFFVFGSQVADSLPGLSAVVFNGNMLAAAGLAWWWWQLRSSGAWTGAILVLSLSALVPLITLVFMGFMGYGVVTMIALGSFVAYRLRVRAVAVLVGLPLLYLIMSVGLTYMAGRVAIRASVWGGDVLSVRAQVVNEQLAGRFQWFDPFDDAQRLFLDARFNQNYFVGMAAERLQRGEIDFADGGTLADGFWALVPRAIWPGKPMISGGSQLMTNLTGIRFAEGVSFGVGHILDMYANFGRLGMVVGFAMFTTLIGVFDRLAGRALADGSFDRFIFWYLSGTALVNGAVGRFSEIPASLIGAFGMAYLLRILARVSFPPNTPTARR